MTLQSHDPEEPAEFDKYALMYESMLAASVSASGEPPEYFAAYKHKLIERMLEPNEARPVLDFGCGMGNLTTQLVKSFPVVHAYDPSRESVKLAKKRAPAATFFSAPEALPENHYSLAVIANVLHHVPVEDRAAILRGVVSKLAPGGRLVIFEHNPRNPLTRRAVSICPFDENAVLLYPREVRRLLVDAQLSNVGLDYVVFFPHALAFARPLEHGLRWLPIGAQVCAWGFRR